MHDFKLVSYKMITFYYNWFDKHFCFFHYVCLCLETNLSDLSFAVHKFWKSNVQSNVLLRKEYLCHTSIQRESKQLSPAKKSGWGCTFFISHLRIHKRNDKRKEKQQKTYFKHFCTSHNVARLTAFFKKNCLYIINEHFWNSPSKQMNSLD